MDLAEAKAWSLRDSATYDTERTYTVLSWLIEELTRLTEERDDATREASALATSMFRDLHAARYQKEGLTWGLCDTPAGVISQIDNMVAGVCAENVQLRELLRLKTDQFQYEAEQNAQLRAQVATAQQSAQDWASRCGEVQAQLERVVDKSAGQVEAARGEVDRIADAFAPLCGLIDQYNGESGSDIMKMLRPAVAVLRKRECSFCGTVNDAHHSAECVDHRAKPPRTYEQGVAVRKDGVKCFYCQQMKFASCPNMAQRGKAAHCKSFTQKETEQ